MIYDSIRVTGHSFLKIKALEETPFLKQFIEIHKKEYLSKSFEKKHSFKILHLSRMKTGERP